MTATATPDSSGLDLEGYARDGYLIVRGLWAPEELAELRAFFDELGERGEAVPGHWSPATDPEKAKDPLKRYPRVMQPHRFSDLCLRFLLDRRIERILQPLLGEPAVACQSMYYYKPPGGRGQAFHQDNFYLRVEPYSCIAAWTAVDPAYPENGGLYVAPGTHRLEVFCPEEADQSQSFTRDYVAPPEGVDPVPARLDPGDVLFFNGSLIHGSQPNTSGNWRRSFICHYMPTSAREVAQPYHPVLDFDGRVVSRGVTQGGGPCGEPFERA